MANKNDNIEDIEVGEVNQDYSSLSGGYNPFAEKVIERDYTKTKQTLTSEQMGDIEEPIFEPPPINAGGSLTEDDIEIDDSNPNVFDENVSDLDPEDKKFAHENLVDTVIGGYEMLHTFAKRWATLTEEKLIEKEKKGEIDLRMQVMVSPVQSLSVFDFVNNYNQQVGEALTVDDDFIEKVRPIMVRVAEKRGLGMTDEQNLMVLFGKDILEKGMQVISFKKSLSNILDLTFQNYQEQRQANQFAQQQPPPPPPPPPAGDPPPPPPPPQFEGGIDQDGFEEESEPVNLRGQLEREGDTEIEQEIREELDQVEELETETLEDQSEDDIKLIEPNANDIQEEEEK